MTEFVIATRDFDASLLPEGSREPGTDSFRDAVIVWFMTRMARIGGESSVEVDGDQIMVRWDPQSRAADPLEYAIDLLRRGKVAEGASALEALSIFAPDDFNIHFNLGMALSDLGQLGDAAKHLERAVLLAPTSSSAVVALGVAQERMGDSNTARRTFETALHIDSSDGYAHRNLGALLMKLGDPESAGVLLRNAYHLLPDDPQAQYGYAAWLIDQDSDDGVAEGDEILKRLIAKVPASHPISQVAKDARSKLAMRNLRTTGVDVRMDAVMYLLGALERFEAMPRLKVQEVGFEVAMLGQRGLDVNDSAQKYSLRTLPGNYSGLHLMSLMYAAFKQIEPGLDIGFDLSKEYEVAQSMHTGGKRE